MKSFRLIFVFLLGFFVLTSSAFAQDRYRANGKRRMSSKSKGTLIGAGVGGTAYGRPDQPAMSGDEQRLRERHAAGSSLCGPDDGCRR